MTTVLDRLNELVHVAVEHGRLAGRKEFGPLSVYDELRHQSSAAQSLALAQRIAGELQFKPVATPARHDYPACGLFRGGRCTCVFQDPSDGQARKEAS